MEEVIDFDKFIANYIPSQPEYEAIYDDDGIVTSICPKGISNHIKNKIDIDLEIVEQIHNGTLLLNNCFVDINSGNLEITKKEYLKKIDDIFHRIPEKKFVKEEGSFDIEIWYIKKTNEFRFQMSENIKSKKIRWSGDTVLNFYITRYNDPHFILKKIDITVDDLYTSDFNVTFKIKERFSIFTRRLFKNYILDIKK